jgi:hypothetical protein
VGCTDGQVGKDGVLLISLNFETAFLRNTSRADTASPTVAIANPELLVMTSRERLLARSGMGCDAEVITTDLSAACNMKQGLPEGTIREK